ncbi:MAG: MFS transporter [Nocardioides sp.]|uniref:MFS transporter n=1 Tax=Nocardioides sp. TaxID=35761 RepID=UPI003D6B34F2
MNPTNSSLIEQTALDDSARHALYRRSLTVVVISQVFGGAGLAAGVTVGALLAQDMLGGEGIAGLPAALFTLGSALAAFTVGRFSQRSGRRVGLTAGFLTGALGAAGIVLAAVMDNPVLLFIALFVYGSGTATNLQARYAGTDLAPPQSRATAVSIAMVSTTFGAVAGPNSIGLLGDLADTIGIPRLAGPFLLAAVAYGLAGLVLFAFLRPDPFLVARAMATQAPAEAPATELTAPSDSPPGDTEPAMSSRSTSSSRGVVLGATIMVLTQIAMIAIMTMTPVHMRHHHHSLDQVGFVIGMHIGAMFLPSLITGRLVDRIGRIPMALASAATLLAAGLTSALAPGDSMAMLTLALVLLGLGWNFGLISGTALIVDSTPLATRAKTQGTVDVLIAIAGASGGAVSGVVVDASSYATLSLAGGFLALLLIPVALWHQTPRRRFATTRPKAANDL